MNRLKDLRAYVAALQEIGELQSIDREVDWNLEIGAIIRHSYDLRQRLKNGEKWKEDYAISSLCYISSGLTPSERNFWMSASVFCARVSLSRKSTSLSCANASASCASASASVRRS